MCPQHRTGDFAFIVDGVLGIRTTDGIYHQYAPRIKKICPIYRRHNGITSHFEDMML